MATEGVTGKVVAFIGQADLMLAEIAGGNRRLARSRAQMLDEQANELLALDTTGLSSYLSDRLMLAAAQVRAVLQPTASS